MGTKISSLPVLSTVTDATIIPVVEGGVNKKITGNTLKTYTGSGSGPQGVTGPQGPSGPSGAQGSSATVPKITGISVTDSGYTVLDDTAVSTAGGYIKITGTGFTAGSQVLIGTVVASSVSFISSTELRAQVPATTAGTYVVYVVAADGAVAIRVNGITFSTSPTWSTASSLGISGTVISIQLAATSDTTITYSLAAGSTLPTGLSLSSSGLLSGTVTGITVDTTYNFTINAVDQENQDSPRTFSITITGKDAYFPYVSLLLNTTSTNIATNNTFLDSSSNNVTLTRTGTPTQGSFTPYWPNGQWSIYFNGSSYLTVGTTASNFLMTGSATGITATFEAWVYPTAYDIGTGATIQFSSVHSKDSVYWNFGVRNGAVRFAWLNAGTYYNVDSASTSDVPLNTWTHIAATISGTTIKIYVNGALSTTSATFNGVDAGGLNQIENIGYAPTGLTPYFYGYISNYRLSNTVVYSSAFTPSTTPLTAISGTMLLICQSNRFIDNSTSNRTIMPYGTARVQTFQPFNPPAAYSASTHGGSGYFAGANADYLNNSSTSVGAFGSSNYTVEFWIYPTAGISSNYNVLISTLNGSTDSGWQLYYYNAGWGVRTNFTNIMINHTPVPTAYAWSHVAWVRNGSTYYLYLNGVQIGTSGTTRTWSDTTIKIGSEASPAVPVYISNVRLVNGTAVYTAAFTPPTTPVTAISGTSLLLNFTNAGIYDISTQNNMTTVGDAQASTTVYKWPPTGMKFDGSGDWLTVLDTPNLQFGAGDFTIEGWFYLAANGAAYGIVSKGTASTGWSVNVTSGNRLQFSYTSSNLTGATTTLAATTWYYFAVVRSGSGVGNLKIYINGSLEATSGGAVTDNFNQTDILYVGASRTGSSALNGYLQDIRITKGTARSITASPTAAFLTK